MTDRSVLVASGLIAGAVLALAAAVWFGSGRVADAIARASSGAIAGSPVEAPGHSPVSPAPPTAPAPALSPDDVKRERQLRVRDQVAAAFQSQRDAYRKTCVTPEVMQAGPRMYQVVFSLDAAGREAHREIRPSPGPPNPRLDDCVKKLEMAPLTIPPPGEPTEGTTTLVLP